MLLKCTCLFNWNKHILKSCVGHEKPNTVQSGATDCPGHLYLGIRVHPDHSDHPKYHELQSYIVVSLTCYRHILYNWLSLYWTTLYIPTDKTKHIWNSVVCSLTNHVTVFYIFLFIYLMSRGNHLKVYQQQILSI